MNKKINIVLILISLIMIYIGFIVFGNMPYFDIPTIIPEISHRFYWDPGYVVVAYIFMGTGSILFFMTLYRVLLKKKAHESVRFFHKNINV